MHSHLVGRKTAKASKNKALGRSRNIQIKQARKALVLRSWHLTQYKDFNTQSTYISESASPVWVPKLLPLCMVFWFYSTQMSSCCAEAALLLGLKSDSPICVCRPAWKGWWGARDNLAFHLGNLCWSLLLGSVWWSCRSYLPTNRRQGGCPPADTMALDLLRTALVFPAVQ